MLIYFLFIRIVGIKDFPDFLLRAYKLSYGAIITLSRTNGTLIPSLSDRIGVHQR